MGGPCEILRGLWDSWKSFRVAGPQMARILIKKRQCRARFFKIPTFRSPEWSSKKSLRGSLERWDSGDRKVGILKNRALHCRFLIKIRARRREARVEFFLEEPLGPHGNSHAAGPGNPLQKGFVEHGFSEFPLFEHLRQLFLAAESSLRTTPVS